MKHTELPWKITDSNRNGDVYIGDDEHHHFIIVENGPFAGGDAKARAEQIVREHNAHEELLTACEWIGKFILTASDGGDAWCAVRGQPGAKEWTEGLKAAIAKGTE